MIDKHHHAPVRAVVCPVVGLSCRFLRHEAEHVAVDVCLALVQQFLTDMGRHFLDVVLQKVHIGEHGVVDPLQHIAGLTGLGGLHLIGVVDQSVAQRSHIRGCTFKSKLCDDVSYAIVHFPVFIDE